MYGLHRRGLLGIGASLALAGMARAQGAGPVANTRGGRVQGLDLPSGVKAFKGVPYGAAGRFAAPKPAAPWTGVLAATAFGPTPPQPPPEDTDYAKLFGWNAASPAMGEDCLTLNVWTPAPSGKRPVIVAFPAEDWVTGSAANPLFDGEALARADMVCVTANRRLGALGFFDVSSQDAPSEFAVSGVAGALDMVAALAWVRDNIASFGGDRGAVTVVGGDEVAVLCAMPAAKGLFHRAALQNPSSPLRVLDAYDASEPAERLQRNLGARDLRGSGGARLHSATWQEIIAAAGGPGGRRLGAMSRVAPPPVNFAPTLNPQALPHHPFHPSAPPESASVPMMVGHCLEAASRRLDNFELTHAAFRAYAFTNVGEARAAEATALYEGETVASPFLRESRLETDRLEGQAADAVAERKAKVGRVYRYVWALPADARFGATSGADLKATFGRDGTATGQAFTRALVAFATSGDPGWQQFNEQTRATMVFGETARVENDPRGALRRLWLQLKAP